MAAPARRLRFLDVFCLGLNAIIGSGIFVFPGQLAALAGPASILAFAACAAALTTVALCYCELGGMFRGSGGSALYAREAFGQEVGFAVGWIAWMTAVLSWTAVASALASQLAYFHPAFALGSVNKATALATLLAFSAVNYVGVRPGAWVVDFLTAAKLLPLALFVAVGVFFIDPDRYRPFLGGEARLGYAVFLALWSLQGFEVAPVPAGETADPQRDVPRAVLGSLLVAGVFYALIQGVAIGAYSGLERSGERPLAEAAGSFLGPWGGGLLALGGVLSMLGFVAGAALGAPRYLVSVGEGAFLRLRLDDLHPRWGTPYRSILWTAGFGVALILVFDFSRLIDLSNLAVVSQYLSTCLALLVLRLRRPGAARAFCLPWAWGVASGGCLVSAWLMTLVGRREALIALALLGLGYALRMVSRLRA